MRIATGFLLVAGLAAPAFGQDAAANAKATVYIYRLKAFYGSALEPSVYCDEIQLARMDNGRYFTVTVVPGVHTLRSNDKQSGIEMNFKAGQEYFVRVEIATGMWKGHGRVTSVVPEQGSYEVRKLKILGPDKVKDRQMVSLEPYTPRAATEAAATEAAAPAAGATAPADASAGNESPPAGRVCSNEKCQAAVPADAQYCPKCGQKVAE